MKLESSKQWAGYSGSPVTLFVLREMHQPKQ